MKTVETIVFSDNGIIDVEVFGSSDAALIFYKKKAEEFGVEYEFDDTKNFDLEISRMIRVVDKQLESTGKEIKWFENKVIDLIK